MLTDPDSTDATSGNAKKTAASVVEVSKVDLPCTDGKANVSDLPFAITLKTTATKDATVTFTFNADGTIKTVAY